jgi:di/tripeptidase
MGDVDFAKIDRLAEIYSGVVKDILNIDVARKSGSTDCNIPLSLGIPAVCIGVWQGSGSHTREEWIEKASLPIGLEVGLRVVTEILKEA